MFSFSRCIFLDPLVTVCGMTCTDIDQSVQLEEKKSIYWEIEIELLLSSFVISNEKPGNILYSMTKSYRGLHTSTRRSLLESVWSYGLSIKDVLHPVAMLRRRNRDTLLRACVNLLPLLLRPKDAPRMNQRLRPCDCRTAFLPTADTAIRSNVEPCFSSSSILPIPNRSHCCHKFPPARHPRSLSSPLDGLLRFC